MIEELVNWIQALFHKVLKTLVICSKSEDTFDVTDFGADVKGVDKSSAAVQKAIDAAVANGGGTVYFPTGQYLCGPIHLKSDVTLHLADDATYEEVRSHLWQHCCWLPIKCRMCKQYLPDAAPFIAKHFIDEHFLHIKQQKYNFVTLYEPNMSFSNEEFVILQKKLIEVNTNSDIEANIRRLLEASEDGYYSRLRKKCDKKVLSVAMLRLTPEQIAAHLEKTDETEDTDRPPEQLAAIEPQRSDASDRISALKNSKDKTNADNNSRDKSSSSSDDRDKSSSSSGKRRGRQPKESSTERALRSDSNSCDKRGDKTDVLLDTINRLKESCRSSGDGNGPNDAMASTSARNNNTLGADNVDMDEDDYRVACYHCNDKFKSKKEFNAHSQKKHPHKSARWYAKQLK
ncbi:unnamed protein product [Oppiella nova]|uniref:C2H2-type domain-containing protein n=1 Tax=Oppiella nova TaxID=334625 RepID=A0A7R9MBM5_9ACAR|nr:unnamed protein product [Oppiella nova]CAG2174332.1 unnamed protein product [Oppiella nova]